MSHHVYLRNPDNTREGEIDEYETLSIVERHNDISTWLLEGLSIKSPLADRFLRNYGLIIELDDEIVFSGRVTRREYQRQNGEYAVSLSGVDDTFWLAKRLALPTLPWASNVYDTRTSSAESLMHAYVDANAGPSATTGRPVPGLVMGTNGSSGDSLTVKARFPNLLELCQEISLQGGGVSFRIRQDGTDLEFQTYMPMDKTASVQFSSELGNLGDFLDADDDPEANYIYVAGTGEGTARVFRERDNSTSISENGRFEHFHDNRQTGVNAELDASGDEQLNEKANKRQIGLSPLDTESLAFRRDYELGDKVRFVVDGVSYDDVIRGCTTTWAPNAPVSVEPVVGTPGASDPRIAPAENEDSRIIVKRLSKLERV